MKNTTNPRRILIVGGVAGGASCAARLRRLDEHAEIHLFERGPYISFANCGLPYHVGDVIPDESSLLVADAELFRTRFRVHVHDRTEVTGIDREQKEIEVRDGRSGEVRREKYDALVLSPGAVPVKPPLPGIDLPGIFTVRNIPDARTIREWMQTRNAKTAVVVGGGFIGLEMAENLVHRGLEVTIVEMLNQVMPPLDPEMAALVGKQLTAHGVRLALGDGVAGFSATPEGGVVVQTASGAEHPADLVILAIGVRPDTSLARAADLTIGPRGGIAVDEQMRTSDPNIYAVGDAVEVRDWVSGDPTLIPLAGPANRQGRIAADAICGRDSKFRGVQGTAIVGLFGLQVASTGASEKALQRDGETDYEKIYLHPNQHSSYYPGAKAMTLKLLFRRSNGAVLGAQGIGEEGVDRRIDAIAMTLQLGGTVHDLAEAELCYAPQFGSAKDPINLAGMIAEAVRNGDMPLVHWNEPARDDTLLVDVRTEKEFAGGHAAGARNIPLDQLRDHLPEIPAQADVRVYCGVGQRGYVATRILQQNGKSVRNVSGGWKSAPVI
jgi:NADPH-dependent 2,4-dienoyl-CoA reductase/sulfur reductase-like enzyme/rhodanese-related sulfurtransferase